MARRVPGKARRGEVQSQDQRQSEEWLSVHGGHDSSYAELLVLDADPVQAIRHLKKSRMVILNGEILDRDRLLQPLSTKLRLRASNEIESGRTSSQVVRTSVHS